MDVDLLRPGTVPISPDTSLWFEFVLEPTALEKHLNNPSADPTPPELITKFLSIAQGDKPVDTVVIIDGNGPNTTTTRTKPSRRSLALKILAIKVASHLKWDIDFIDKKLPLGAQSVLLKDLLNFSCPQFSDIPSHIDLQFEKLSPHVLFAITFYHRWVLRTYVSSALSAKQAFKNSLSVDWLPAEIPWEELTEGDAERSYEVLQKLAETPGLGALSVPAFKTWVPLSEDGPDPGHDWSTCANISVIEYLCQIYMDLATYLIFKENYAQAKELLKKCLNNFCLLRTERGKDELRYCLVNDSLLSGFCTAVGIKQGPNNPKLVQQFHNAVVDQYVGINKVLEKDNLAKEIPVLYRESLELDIASEVASRKVTAHRDGVVQIQALNVIRRALGGGSWNKPKIPPVTLNKALMTVINSFSEVEKKNLRYFILETLASSDSSSVRKMCEQPCIKELVTEDEIEQVVDSGYSDPVPVVLLSILEAEECPVSKNIKLELAATERFLVASYDDELVKRAVFKLTDEIPNFSISKLYRNWDYSRYVSYTHQFGPKLQNFFLVLLAKANELTTMKNFQTARTMLRAICNHSKERGTTPAYNKLEEIVSMETISVDVAQFHSEWPAKHMDWNSLSQGCLMLLHKVDGTMVRPCLREQCALTLLNMGHWQPLLSLPHFKINSPVVDLYLSIASACLDITKFNNKKVCIEVWDKFLPVFLCNQKKREESTFTFLLSIVELNALAIVISLLAKVHNILTDQPVLDLYIPWPDTIKNSHQYSVKLVSELLMEMLEHTLTLYPNNVSWLKLKGDLHFVNSNYTSALSRYIEASIAATDYFSRPLHKNILDDLIIKRMIKCCMSLQCYTQAAVLCQFLEDIDYSTAFKCLSEVSCCDAMDSYYTCIWDVNILEFLINLHTKKGEHFRKQKAIRIIGELELNGNNNDEIKREAENIRKSRFMRAMAHQYLYGSA